MRRLKTMSDRDKLLYDKGRDIADHLDRWAGKKKLLLEGERIIFSLSIVNAAAVFIQIPSGSILEMRPQEFFTKQRLLEAGIDPRSKLVRILNAIGNANVATVKDLIQFGRNNLRLQSRGNLGKVSLDIISRVLSAHGIDFPQ
jgi:hypothetical protein